MSTKRQIENKSSMKKGRGWAANEQEVEKMKERMFLAINLKCNKGSFFKDKSIWRHLGRKMLPSSAILIVMTDS